MWNMMLAVSHFWLRTAPMSWARAASRFRSTNEGHRAWFWRGLKEHEYHKHNRGRNTVIGMDCPLPPGRRARGRRPGVGTHPASGRPGIGTHLGSPWPRYDIHYESRGFPPGFPHPDPPPPTRASVMYTSRLLEVTCNPHVLVKYWTVLNDDQVVWTSAPPPALYDDLSSLASRGPSRPPLPWLPPPPRRA